MSIWRRAAPALVAEAAVVIVLLAGCGGGGAAVSPAPGAAAEGAGAGAASQATAALRRQVAAQFSTALAALATGDAAAWRAATPSGAAVRDHLDMIYRQLEPLNLGGLAAHVHAIPGKRNVFDVQITGQTGPAGPPDRLVAELLVRATAAAQAWKKATPATTQPPSPSAAPVPSASASPSPAGVVFVEDLTPPKVAVEYFMAFVHAARLDAPGCVVIYERAWRLRAARMAELERAARDSVCRRYAISDRRPITILVYGTSNEAFNELGLYPGDVEHSLKYFTGSPARLSSTAWPLGDVSVVAPALTGVEDWAPVMLRHEVAHAYTWAWFQGLARRPDFLSEGLAVAAQGTEDYELLKQAAAAGTANLSLTDAIAVGDIWENGSDDVRESYQAAGATVSLILRDWGPARLRRWVIAVAGSDLSSGAIARATRRELGVSWKVFLRRWRAYVQTL